jgi:DNA-directed RNA polymerase specialized sigma24 family protein
VAASESPWSSRGAARLFELGEEDGRVALKSFANSLGAEDLRDLIRGWLFEHLSDLATAEDPRGFFFKSIVRAAISRRRKLSTHVEEAPEEERVAPEHVPWTEEEQIERLDVARDLRRAIAQLSPKELQIMSAIALGEDREALAKHFNTSRNNIDQIVRRVHLRFAGGDEK